MVENAYQKTDATENKDSSAFNAEVKVQRTGVGSSGTEIFAGYFSEEYLQNLRGTMGAKTWDEMRRSESQVAMLMAAIMNPIKAASWTFEPFDGSEEAKLHADLVSTCLKDQIDWDTFLHEALTFLPFGFSLFEVVHNVVHNDERFGTFNGLLHLGFRSQKTIERWNLEKKTGKILSVDQYVYSDIGDNVTIDGNFILVFTNQKEGDNYEGISVLRPMFGPWSRKNLYLKLAAIGLEKYAIGVPIGTIPAGKESTPEVGEFREVLANFTSNEVAYITKPEGWNIEIQKSDFDVSKIKDIILLENTEMINSVVANFLALGTNGSGGAFALGSDLSDFFLSGIQSYANLICGVINRMLAPNLVRLNFGPQKGYPKLKCSGINDKAGKELAEIVKMFVDGNVITPDPALQEFLRDTYKLPKAEPVEVVQAPPTVLHEQNILLDEKYRKSFDKNKEKVKAIITKNLPILYTSLIDQIKTKYKQATPSGKLSIVEDISAKGVPAYRNELKEALAQISFESLQDARRKVPSKKNVKLAEGSFWNGLPPYIKKLVESQAYLISDTQAADLEKKVFFQFMSSASSYDDLDQIVHDIDDSVAKLIDSGNGGGMNADAAASNAVAQASNQSQMAFYFDPEVLDEIESFTFTNEDPVSPICQELNGTTFSPNDPNIDTYQPPLHHNCKSRLVPNLKGAKGNPDIERGGLSISQKGMDSITLSEHVCSHARELYRLK